MKVEAVMIGTEKLAFTYDNDELNIQLPNPATKFGDRSFKWAIIRRILFRKQSAPENIAVDPNNMLLCAIKYINY